MNLIRNFISCRESEIELIRSKRKEELQGLARLISNHYKTHNACNVTIICTHNSRRSQLTEFTLRLAVSNLAIDNLNIFSGGTEATSFNFRMVRALEHFGFDFEKSGDDSNPEYSYKSLGISLNQKMFSKVYDHETNPQKDFIAIMVCNHADQNCPIVAGAKHRFSLPYLDPKMSDNSPEEESVYIDKVKEIGREMVYLANLISTDLDS